MNKITFSIVIYDYEPKNLAHCLDHIFFQTAITDFEIIYCDDHPHEEGWIIANHYARQHPGRITLTRKKSVQGLSKSRKKANLLCRSQYKIELTGCMTFDPDYILHIVEKIQKDPLYKHEYIKKTNRRNFFLPPPMEDASLCLNSDTPLVSICVYNFNYGRFLSECLTSIFSQTYTNFEVCFSDNASSDESWDVVMDFSRRFPNKINLTRNRINLGPNINLWNCLVDTKGKYLLKLCSDDALHPRFIETCVQLLEQHANAAFAMVHRSICDEHGVRTEEPPFYNQSYLIPGEEQAAVYMMALINPSTSQIIYNREKQECFRYSGSLNERWFGDHLIDFHLCCEHPIIYIHEPLLINRIHSRSDGSSLNNNILQCICKFVLLHQFTDIATSYPNTKKVKDRLFPAIAKLGELCLRYCMRSLLRHDEETARRYWHLATAIHPNIIGNEIYNDLELYWQTDDDRRIEIIEKLLATDNFVHRTTSYPPPPGSKLVNSA